MSKNRLRNSHYGQPPHSTEKSLKPKILELGEIDTSPWNYFPLSKLLLVPLIILDGIEKGRVKPRFSTSLRLSKLR